MTERILMKTLLRRILCCVALLVAAPAHAAGVVAKLVVPETRLLPGVCFEAWIELDNQSTETIAVGLSPTLLATGPQGERFEARSEKDDFLLGYDSGNPPTHYLQMKSHERRTIPMAFIQSGPYVVSDVRILYPGTYTIAVRLGEWTTLQFPPPVPPEYAGPIVTNEVTIERIATGEDAVVWQRMQEFANGAWNLDGWQNRLLSEEIVEKHPTSNYVPYAMLANAFMDEKRRQLQLLLDTIRRFPNSPMLEYVRYFAASNAAYIGEYDIRDREIEILRQSRRPTIRFRVLGRDALLQ
jgi:hypothetical protein